VIGDETTRARIVEIARSWIGTPYHHRARLKGVGVDCAQLLIGVFAEAGLIESFDTGEYPMDWAAHRDDERFLGWVAQHAAPTSFAMPGDLLVFRYFRCYSHGAIVVDDALMIHSFIGRGVEIVERADFALRPHLAFTLFGSADGR
jgi:NlpC/P60 family putative phage cell wall peptidase